MPLRLKSTYLAENLRGDLQPGGGVAFVFHATDWATLEFAFESVGPRTPALEEELWTFGPFIGSPIQLDSRTVGANIISPVPAELWVGRPARTKRFRDSQFLPALQLAESCGLTIAALGALTPYACNYGRGPRNGAQIALTTGHAATAAMLIRLLHHVTQLLTLPFHRSKVALFGASGMMGSVVGKLIAAECPSELILIDLPSKRGLLRARLKELSTGLCRVSAHEFLSCDSLPNFDGALLVSNASAPYLTANALQRAKFWIDDSHPRAASFEAEFATQGRTLYLECYSRGPSGLDVVFPFRLPTRRDCYSCFSEGWVAFQEGFKTDFITGVPSLSAVGHVAQLVKKYGFEIGPLVRKNGSLVEEIGESARMGPVAG